MFGGQRKGSPPPVGRPHCPRVNFSHGATAVLQALREDGEGARLEPGDEATWGVQIHIVTVTDKNAVSKSSSRRRRSITR